MASAVLVNGKYKTRPGVYASIVSGVKNPSRSTTYGNVLIIDSGIGAGFGGGSGINGYFKNGADSIYNFTSKEDFQAFIKGGEVWNLAKPLFTPSGSQPGVTGVSYIKAATTTPAEIAWICANGNFTIQTRDEGPGANGALDSSNNLSVGIGTKLVQVNVPPTVATFSTVTTQAAAAAINETKATATVTITAVGSNGDTITVNNINSSGLLLGSYTKITGDTTTAQVATALAAAITGGTSGYTAVAVGAVITITSPAGLGATNNGVSLYVVNTGGIAWTKTSYAGGVTAVAAKAQINTVTATGINIGDTFSVTQSAITKTVTATSTVPATVYAALAAAINADSTLNTVVTASVGTGLIITGNVVNTPFTQTSATTPAPVKFVFQIWHGTYKGLDSLNNVPYDNVVSSKATPILLCQSTTLTTVSDLINWFNTSSLFNTGFKLKPGYTATGALLLADISSNTTNGWKLASGGTEVYNQSDFTAAISKINSLDYTHILSTDYGANAVGSNNDALQDFVVNNSKYKRILVIAGGYDASTRATQSINTAAYTDSDEVVVVHGGVKKTSRGVNGFYVYSQLYHAAAITGRCLGLPPQVPVTLKSIDIDGLVDPLEDADQTDLISAGVMYSYYDTELGTNVVGLDVDSIQSNDYLINDDGTSYSWQLKRIEADVLKRLTFAGKQRFFNPTLQGGNRNTSSPDEVVVWAQNELQKMTASTVKDDLIISYQNVVASLNQDNIYLSFEFVANTEVKTLVITGTIIAG